MAQQNERKGNPMARITISSARNYRALNDLMELDHVIRVHSDETVSEPGSVWAPSVYDNGPANGPEDIQVDGHYDGTPWALLTGWSAQYNYRGPVMGPGEYVGGALARHILDTPGLWVAVTVGESDGWALAYYEEDNV